MPLPRAASECAVCCAGNGCSVLASLGIGKTPFIGASAKHEWGRVFQDCKMTSGEMVSGGIVF